MNDGIIKCDQLYDKPPDYNDIKESLSPIFEIYRKNGDLISKLSKTITIIDLMVLILSVLTASSIWLLLGDAIPKITLWIGAISSTIVTGLTIYKSSTGIARKKRDAIIQYERIGVFIANVRSGQIITGSNEFWKAFKSIQAASMKLKHGDYA